MKNLDSLLYVFGIFRKNTKENAVRIYLDADEKSEKALKLCAGMFDGVQDLKDTLFRMNLWRKDIFPSAEIKMLKAEEKDIPEMTSRLYRLEKAVRQKTRRARKKAEGKMIGSGPRVRLTPKLCAMASLSMAKTGGEGDLYLAGVLDGLSFSPVKEGNEKSFFPAWSRFITDCAKVVDSPILSPEEFRESYQNVTLKAESGQGITREEASILEAFEAVS